MTTEASKTNTFVPGTDIEAAKVNQNFDDLVGYMNSSLMTKDGGTAFTGIPSGPATYPTTANQLTRKQYVDGVLGFSSGTTPLYTIAATVKSAFAAVTASLATVTANVVQRLKFVGAGGGVSAGAPAVASNQYQFQAGHGGVFLDGTKRATITLPVAFPTGLLTVLAVAGAEDEMGVFGMIVDGYTTSSFRVTLPGAGISYHKINWIAIGW